MRSWLDLKLRLIGANDLNLISNKDWLALTSRIKIDWRSLDLDEQFLSHIWRQLAQPFDLTAHLESDQQSIFNLKNQLEESLYVIVLRPKNLFKVNIWQKFFTLQYATHATDQQM